MEGFPVRHEITSNRPRMEIKDARVFLTRSARNAGCVTIIFDGFDTSPCEGMYAELSSLPDASSLKRTSKIFATCDDALVERSSLTDREKISVASIECSGLIRQGQIFEPIFEVIAIEK